MQYQEAVQEARRLVKRSEDDQWRLAQLTWEQVEAGKSRRQWAQDIGIGSRHADRLFIVWDRWGAPDRRSGMSFSEAYTDADPSTATEARHLRTVRNMPVEQKAEVARELLAEPKVADSVLRDTHTRRQITDARQRIVEEIETAAHDREHADPVGRAVREATLALEIENDISSARWKLAEATRKITDLADRDPATMQRFGRALDEVDVVRDWLRTLLAGGTVSDDELAKLLEGGAE